MNYHLKVNARLHLTFASDISLIMYINMLKIVELPFLRCSFVLLPVKRFFFSDFEGL